MTIFQKMLIVPVISLILYSGFIIYSYGEHQKSSDKIIEIRDHYFPTLELVNNSTTLFHEIREIYKDSVLADESAWLPHAQKKSKLLLTHLSSMKQNFQIIDLEKVKELENSFSNYHRNAETLAKKVLIEHEQLLDQTELVKNIEHFHNSTEKQLSNLKIHIKERFHRTIDDTNKVMNTLLFLSSFIAIGLLVFLLAATLFVSLSTYQRFKEVSIRMKELAQGGTDFSRRLVHNKKDELGYLIHWFNKLSDKLEQDYLQIERVSITDKLTQLNNRMRADSYFLQALEQVHQQKISLTVMLLDIDFFKKINDEFGHLVGDQVLQSFAKILKMTAIDNTFIGRWGGEEFILIISNLSSEQSVEFANKVRMEIERFHFAEVGQVTASFGITMHKISDDQNSMMKRADEALYEAKAKGRNCIVMSS